MMAPKTLPAKRFVRFISSTLMGTIISLLLLFVISVLLFFVGALTRQPFALSLGPLLFVKVEQGQLGVTMGIGLFFVSIALGLLNAFVREVFLAKSRS